MKISNSTWETWGKILGVILVYLVIRYAVQYYNTVPLVPPAVESSEAANPEAASAADAAAETNAEQPAVASEAISTAETGSTAEAVAKPESAVQTAGAGDAANGEVLYNQTCVACHGPGGVGVAGLGKNMTTSTFIAGLDDAQLLDFIKKGRDTGDALNTTGVAMPPKGGNPALNDQKLLDIIAYVRTIHKP